MASHIERRKFLATLGGAAATWPLAHAQQPAMPVVRLVHSRSLEGSRHAAAFTQGLSETGYVEGQNVVAQSKRGARDGIRVPTATAAKVSYRRKEGPRLSLRYHGRVQDYRREDRHGERIPS
jgi:hypothetical protein